MAQDSDGMSGWSATVTNAITPRAICSCPWALARRAMQLWRKCWACGSPKLGGTVIEVASNDKRVAVVIRVVPCTTCDPLCGRG